MAASELHSKGGAIDYYYHNETPGIEWLSALRIISATPPG
jgi:hypothetical protein